MNKITNSTNQLNIENGVDTIILFILLISKIVFRQYVTK